jgi:Protein of unknown function (DUF1566)
VRAVRDNRYRKPKMVRYTPNGDEVLDALTGLIWRRCQEGQTWDGNTCNGKPTLFTWTDALGHTKALQGQGVSWRMPNVKELASLVMTGQGRSAWNEEFFPNAWRGLNQTSTPVVLNNDKNWSVSFSSGVSTRIYRYFTGAVRLVREAD